MERRKAYPSDISREQLEATRPILEGVRKRTKPRTVDWHEVFNAVLYVLKSGCQWRMLWKNCERKLNTSLQMVHLSFLRLLLRRA
jgi:transposase